MSSKIESIFLSSNASILIVLDFANFIKSLFEKIFYISFFFLWQYKQVYQLSYILSPALPTPPSGVDCFEILTLRPPWIKRSFVNNANSSWDVRHSFSTRCFNDIHRCDFNSPAHVKLNRVTLRRFRVVIMQIRGERCFNRSSDLSL